jgi:hypothetical protein
MPLHPMAMERMMVIAFSAIVFNLTSCLFSIVGAKKCGKQKTWKKSGMAITKAYLQPSGVYVYWLSYNTMTTQNNVGKEVKGSITLIR